MSHITLTSSHKHPIKPLVAAALTNELHRLQAGVRRTEQRLHGFEERYQMPTDKFVKKFLDDELDETLEFMEWMGEYKLLERLNEKVGALQGIEIAH